MLTYSVLYPAANALQQVCFRHKEEIQIKNRVQMIDWKEVSRYIEVMVDSLKSKYNSKYSHQSLQGEESIDVAPSLKIKELWLQSGPGLEKKLSSILSGSS